MSKWVQGKVAGVRRWTDRLVSIEVEAPEVSFVAGQFGRLGLPAPPGSKEEMVGRRRGARQTTCTGRIPS